MKIVILDGYTADLKELRWDFLPQGSEVKYYDLTDACDTAERVRDAEIVLTNKVVMSEEVMAQSPRLKYIGVVATGYNVVDVKAASKLGITVTNIPAYSTMSVAQMAMAHLLNITNAVALHAQSVRDGEWESCPHFCYLKQPITELDGLVFGIVGLGNTGTATARMAQSMGMKVMAVSGKPEETLASMGIAKAKDCDELFAACDVLSLHCPLTPETHHLVNARRLALMKKNAIVINTGRGPLVDEQALADALNEGRIMAAGVDVLEEEAPRHGSPLIHARHCHITPHIAWASVAAKKRLLRTVADNIEAFLAGRPVNVVS